MWGDNEEDYNVVSVTDSFSGKRLSICEPQLPRLHVTFDGWEVTLDWMIPLRGNYGEYECVASRVQHKYKQLSQVPEHVIKQACDVAKEITRRFQTRFGAKIDSKSS